MSNAHCKLSYTVYMLYLSTLSFSFSKTLRPINYYWQARIKKLHTDVGHGTGAPNDGFLLNALKSLFWLSRVLLDLQKCILSDAIGICSVIHNPWIWCLPFLKKRDRGTQHQFSENICSEHDLISISGTFVVTFLACLPPLGFSNI